MANSHTLGTYFSPRMLDSLFTGIAFIVAAYILQYGIALQDEVDHTL